MKFLFLDFHVKHVILGLSCSSYYLTDWEFLNSRLATSNYFEEYILTYSSAFRWLMMIFFS